MGCTMSGIQTHFNDIVEMYEAMGFEKVPCSAILYSGSIVRSVDLVKDTHSIRVKLCSNTVKSKEFRFGVMCYDLEADLYVNYKVVATELFTRFYFIDSNYFVTDLTDVRHARSVRDSRSQNRLMLRYKTLFLDVNKLTWRSQQYIRNIVSSALALGDSKSHQYAIYDIYFTHIKNVRYLVIVFRCSDRTATEAIFFNPITHTINYNPY